MLERNTLMFDYCWVCADRFQNSLPAGSAMREDHHIFPRNAGGDDGPLVSLCSGCHAKAHGIANKLHTQKPYTTLLAGMEKSSCVKLAWLADKIFKAEKAIENDPNKLLRNTVMLNTKETAMLEHLQKMLGKSRNDLFKAGLQLLYARVKK